MASNTGIDPTCAYCRRPIVGGSYTHGAQGPYHWECTHGPGYQETPIAGPTIAIGDTRYNDLADRVAKLEQRIADLAAKERGDAE